MNEYTIMIAVYGLVSLVAILFLGIAVFVVWFVVTKSLWTYRYFTRRHLYVPILAKVDRVLSSPFAWLSTMRDKRQTTAMIWVTYEHNGRIFHNRLTVNQAQAESAGRTGAIRLRIDPDRPKDAVVVI